MFLGAVCVPLLGSLLTTTYLQALAHAGYWYEDKVGKAALLNARRTPPEVVFLGASTTQDHIDTRMLAEAGIDSFNYGVAGLTVGEYPYMVNVATHAATSTIVLTFLGHSLVGPPPCPRRPTLYDLAMSGYGARCLREMKPADYKWLLPWVRLTRAIASPLDQGPDTAALSALGESFGIDLVRGIPPINYIRGDAARGVILFQNGDGLVLRRLQPGEQVQNNAAPADQRQWNPENVAYIANLIGMIRESGKRPVLLLAGVNRVEEHATARALATRFDVDVIDAANWRFPRSDWADYLHLNPDGAAAYSQRLVTELRALRRTTSVHPAPATAPIAAAGVD